jgi:hypothetical protein
MNCAALGAAVLARRLDTAIDMPECPIEPLRTPEGVQIAKSFLNQYRRYLDPGKADVIGLAIKQWEDALSGGNRAESQRLVDVLNEAIMNSGVASRLFAAERALQLPRSGDVTVLVETIQQLKSAYDRGDEQEKIGRLSSTLEAITERVLRWQPEVTHTLADVGLWEVTATSLGIAVLDSGSREVFEVIIPRGTPYPLAHPCQKTFRSTTERLIRIPVYEGNNPIADRNDLQGIVEYSMPEIIPIGTPVLVSFDYDRDRVLRVTVDVVGYPELKSQQPLLRDSLRRITSESETTGGITDLKAAVEAVEPLLAQYGQYLAAAVATRIRSDLQRAEVTLQQGDSYPTKTATSTLIQDVMASDLGVLLVAERAISLVPPADADLIRRAITELNTAYIEGNTRRRIQIQMALQVALTRMLQQEADQAEGTRDYDGLLRMAL